MTTSTRSTPHRALITGTLLVLLAALPRLIAPGISEFKLDEASLSLLALDMASGRTFALVGIGSSVGFPNTPVAVWLYALPYLAGPNPALAVIWTALLNVIGAALLWALARRLFGPRVATFTGLLYAASPWLILFSRKVWAQDLLMPFVVGAVYAGLVGFQEDRRGPRIAGWVLLALAVQVHYAGIVLIPVMALLALLNAKRPLYALLTGAGIGLISLIPFVLGLRAMGLLSLAAFSALGSDGGGLTFSADALHFLWMLLSGRQIHSFAGPEAFGRYLESVPVGYPVFQVLPVLALAGLFLLVWRRREHWRQDAVIAAWALIPALIFLPGWTPVTPHYLIPAMPAALLLVGNAVDRLWAALDKHAPGWIAGGMVGGIVLLQLIMTLGLLRFVDNNATPGGFGVPLNRLMPVREAALDSGAGTIIIGGAGASIPFDEDPTVWQALLYDQPDLRFIDARSSALFVDGSAVEIVHRLPDVLDGPARDYWRYSTADGLYPARLGEPGYAVREPHPPTAEVGLRSVDLPLDSGPVVTGIAFEEGITRVRLALVDGFPASPQITVQYFDGDGVRLAQYDGATAPLGAWSDGARLVLWLPVERPGGAVEVLVGLYAFAPDGAINGLGSTVVGLE